LPIGVPVGVAWDLLNLVQERLQVRINRHKDSPCTAASGASPLDAALKQRFHELALEYDEYE
jgi:hypothetical protein